MRAVHVADGTWPPAVFQINGEDYMPPLRQVIDLAVALVFGVDVHDMRAKRRGSPKVAFARQVSMYLAHVACSLSLTEVGVLYGKERTTVAHACCHIEDRRDDHDLDLRLDHLEHAVIALVSALASCKASQ
jgi:hypothetical protein